MKTKNIIIFLAAFITGFGITFGASAQLKDIDLFGDAVKLEVELETPELLDEVYELDLDEVGVTGDADETAHTAVWAPTGYDD